MASPLVTELAAWATLWEALTPPDRTSITYHEIDAGSPLGPSTGDRCFWFSDVPRGEVGAEFGGASESSHVWWPVEWNLRLSSAGRSMSAMRAAIINETNLFCRTIEKRTGYTSGVVEMIVEPVIVDRDDNHDAIITGTVRVLCQETD